MNGTYPQNRQQVGWLESSYNSSVTAWR